MSKENKKKTCPLNSNFAFAVVALLTAGLLLYTTVEVFNCKQDIAQINERIQNSPKFVSTHDEQKIEKQGKDEDNEINKNNSKEVDQKDVDGSVENVNNFKEIIYNKDGSIYTSDWKEYVSKEINIKFRYPAYWGEIIVNKEECCNDEKDDSNKFQNPCYHISLGTEKVGLFLATETLNRKDYVCGRGMYWGDTVFLIKSEKDVKNFCITEAEYKTINKCQVYKTKNGLVVAKNKEALSFANNKYTFSYYIYIPSKIHTGIKLSTERLSYSDKINEQIIEKIIESLKF